MNVRTIILSTALSGAVLLFSACAASPASASAGLHYGETPRAVQTPFTPASAEPAPVDSAPVSDAFRIGRANIYTAKESLLQDNLLLDNLQIRKTKEMPSDISRENFKFFHFGDETDQNFKLTGAVSYLFLDMDATNMGDTDLSFTWNSMMVFATDEDGWLDSSSMLTPWEMRYRSGKSRDAVAKDFYRQELAPGETVHITIGFIIDDSYIDSENLYFTPASSLDAGSYNTWKLYRLNTTE